MATIENVCENMSSSTDKSSGRNNNVSSNEVEINIQDSIFSNSVKFSDVNHSNVSMINTNDCCETSKKLHKERFNLKTDAISTITFMCKKDNEVQSLKNESCDTALPYNETDCTFSTYSSLLPINEELNDIVELINTKYQSDSKDGCSNDTSLSINNFSLNSLDPLDTDENTTQLRITHIYNEQLLSSSYGPAHFYAETTLPVHTQKENNSEQFQEFSYYLPSSNIDDESDQESSASDDNSNIATDFIPSSSLASVEESSLDSGIASLDDAEQTNKSSESNSKHQSKNDKVNSPCSISGKKRHLLDSSSTICKQAKLSTSQSKVTFNGVTIYYFPRKQSFVTVPSQGGSTLGMSLQHTHSRQMTLNQHKRAISRHRRKRQKFDANIRHLRQAYPDIQWTQLMSLASTKEEGGVKDSSDEELSDIDDESSGDEVDDDDYLLLPIPAKKRRMLLRMAGVQKIDFEEKLLNKLTRESREICGCSCIKVCLPASCQCALAGIPCQVDRESFPCGCVVTGCCNPRGRVEFDTERVKRHYFETMKKLRLQETGLLPRDVLADLPQPPKSPYVSVDTIEEENLSTSQHQSNESHASMLQGNNCSTNFTQSVYDESELSCNPYFSSSSTVNNTWSVSFRQSDTNNFISGYSFEFPDCESNNVNPATSFFESSSVCDVTSGFICGSSSDSTETGNANYQLSAPVSDFNVDFGLTNSDGENKLSSVFGQGAQFGHKQTFKLEPIASFFPPSGRRLSDEPNSLHDHPLSRINTYMNVQSPISSTSTCSHAYSIKSLICPDEPNPPRSRSSSLSECSHDSVIKA